MYRTKTPRISKRGKREALYRVAFAVNHLRFVGNDDFVGQPFEFEQWELDNIMLPIFGCGKVDRKTGRFVRKYRQALLGVPRGMGKSVIACVILLAEASINPVPNGQYGIVAADEDQAKHVYEYLMSMINTSDVLWKVWEVRKGEIRNRETNQVIKVFPNKESSLQSWHFNVVILDELHVYKDKRIWDAATSGQKNIPNALAIGITTASGAREGFMWDFYSDIKNGVRRLIYCYWVGIDDDDDPHDRRCWEKVMISPRVTMGQLEEQLDNLKWRSFIRYQLNQFPFDAREDPFVSARDVERCQLVEGTVDHGEWYAVGIDAATNGDDTAMVAAQHRGDGVWVFEEWVWPGEHIDFYDLAKTIEEKIAVDACQPTIVVDPNRLKMVEDWLWNERQIELFDYPQTPKMMAPASERLRWVVHNGNAALAGLEYLPRHLLNAVAVESKSYGDRIASTGHGQGSPRIDAAVAAAMAMDYYDHNQDEHVGSVSTLFVEFNGDGDN